MVSKTNVKVVSVIFLAGLANSILPIYIWDSLIVKFVVFLTISAIFAAFWFLIYLILIMLAPWKENKSVLATYPLIPKVVEGLSTATVVYTKGIEIDVKLSPISIIKIISFTPISTYLNLITTITIFLITLLLLKPVKITYKTILLSLVPAIVAYVL